MLQLQIRVEANACYKAFRVFCKELYPNHRVPSIDTFLKNLDAVGCIIPQKRQKIRKRSLKVIDLIYNQVRGAFVTKYKTDFPVWWSESMETQTDFIKNLADAIG